MNGMNEYLAWRGDLTFEERPFNEVDNLIFSKLAYLDLAGAVPEEIGRAVTLIEAYDALAARGLPSAREKELFSLFDAAAHSARFGAVLLGGYVNKIDRSRDLQFSAVTFFYDAQNAYIAFRGTDDSFAGWQEDLDFLLASETAGQAEAVSYIARAAKAFDGALTVGGHSKGGNFAVYGAMLQHEETARRIVRVYSNDGPGFNSAVTSTPAYREIGKKVVKIIPESSIVGILLSGDGERTIVKSSARGILQHNPCTWEVRGESFVRCDKRSYSSVFADETLGRWTASLDEEQKIAFVHAVFDLLESSGADSLGELGIRKRDCARAILKAALRTDRAGAGELFRALGGIANTGKDVLVADVSRKIGQTSAVKKLKAHRAKAKEKANGRHAPEKRHGGEYEKAKRQGS